MHGPPVSQLPRHEPLPSHQPMHQHQQHHRQDLPLHHQQQHLNLNEPHPMMHHGQNPFHQQTHGNPRQMTPRPQNPLLRNTSSRQRMVSDYHVRCIYFLFTLMNLVVIYKLYFIIDSRYYTLHLASFLSKSTV